jgi:hypothetical protein
MPLSPPLALVLALLVLAGCGGRGNEPLAQYDEGAAAEVRARSGDGELGFVPPTYREGGRVVLPITFPDGSRAELLYPPELEIAQLGVFPYTSGTLRRISPTPARGDSVARDFVIHYGDLDALLVSRNEGKPPRLLAQYEGGDGQTVGLWDFGWNDTAHYLGFQFGRWAVLVYDYIAEGAAMTEAERASWAASFAGRKTDEAFLLLEGSGPLRLARVGEHAGPRLTFSAGEPTRALLLFPGECRPHPDQTLLVDGTRVQWHGRFASWCLSGSMNVHAEGSRDFIGALIRGLEVRNVAIAPS